jgi:rubrerythrin
MEGQGFREVYNLKGGIKAWEGLTARGPVEMEMEHLRGDETPKEIITLAYGMEEGLSRFYKIVAEKNEDPEVGTLLKNLAEVEEEHKQRLFDLYDTLNDLVIDKALFEAKIVTDAMEGGFTPEEFLENNRSAMETVSGVIDVAMMLETQALDLYLRYSQRTEDKESRDILLGIAEEEKAHLRALGDLMGKEGQTG